MEGFPANQAEELIPKSLDDIVRNNRDELRLALVEVDDIHSLSHQINTSTFNGTFVQLFLYKRVIKACVDQPICAVGYLKTEFEKVAYHTSRVKYLDIKQKIIHTSSGNNYYFEKFVLDNKPDTTLLMHICAVSHVDGWGPHFGVPNFFY